MVPCSMMQIVEEGRLRQQDALAAAERERRAVRAAQGASGGDAAPGRGLLAALALATARQAGRLVAAVCAVVRLRGAHP